MIRRAEGGGFFEGQDAGAERILPSGIAVTLKEELHTLVDALDDEAASELLDYAQWLGQDEDIATPGELARARAGQAAIASGDYVDFQDLRQQLGL